MEHGLCAHDVLVDLKVGKVGQHLGHALLLYPKPLGDWRPHPLKRSRGNNAPTANALLAAVGQVGRISAKDLAALDRPAQDELVSSPTVIGAGTIRGQGASELRDRHDCHVLPAPLRLHLCHESGQRLVNLSKLALEDAVQLRVRIEADCASRHAHPAHQEARGVSKADDAREEARVVSNGEG